MIAQLFTLLSNTLIKLITSYHLLPYFFSRSQTQCLATLQTFLRQGAQPDEFDELASYPSFSVFLERLEEVITVVRLCQSGTSTHEGGRRGRVAVKAKIGGSKGPKRGGGKTVVDHAQLAPGSNERIFSTSASLPLPSPAPWTAVRNMQVPRLLNRLKLIVNLYLLSLHSFFKRVTP